MSSTLDCLPSNPPVPYTDSTATSPAVVLETYAQVLLQLVYLAVNAFCCCFKVLNALEASIRAARLSLLNLIPAYFGPHFSFICNFSGVSLHSYRVFHGSTATMPLLLGLVHHDILRTHNESPDAAEL